MSAAMLPQDRERIVAFIDGNEVVDLLTARRMMGGLLSWHDTQVEIAKRDLARLRDRFACAALVHAMTSEDGAKAALDAYEIADAMLKVRDGRLKRKALKAVEEEEMPPESAYDIGQGGSDR